MKKRQTTFECRFPGCDYAVRAPQPRGRHESQVHGMVKGELLPAPHPIDLTPAESLVDAVGRIHVAASANGNGHMSPIEHLSAALADLRDREKALSLEIARLALIQQERDATVNSIIIIDKAIGDLATGGGLKA